MKGENINILKKSIRQRRAISSGLYENGIYNYSEEEKNKSKNSIKSFHRKTTSSYFCGSYLSSNLEDELLNNINIDQIYSEKNNKKEYINDTNNKENNLEELFDVSFHSYESSNEEENIKLNKEEKLKENKIKTNFVSFKNNLKNIKDKEERATKSYLLALGMTKNQNRNEQYIPTVSVIEEEKSDVIDSKSEFSNKKKNIKDKYFFKNKDNLFLLSKDNKLKIKNILIKKNNNFEIINNKKEENKNNEENIKEKNKNKKLGIKLSYTLNEIIIKNNKKEENKRKCLKKNKILLLNSFFNSESKNRNTKNNINIQNNNEKNKNIFKNTETNRDNFIEKLRNKIGTKFQIFMKEKIRNSYFSNFIKKRYNTDNNINNEKKCFKNKILQNKVKNNKTIKEDNTNTKFIKYDDLEDIINKKNMTIKKVEQNKIDYDYKQKTNIPIITRIEYKPRSKIPHLRQKIIEKKELYSISNINQNNTNYSSNKKSAPNRKYISKYKNIPHKKNYSFTKDKIINNKENKENFHSMKHIKSINEAFEIVKIEKIKTKNKNRSSLKNYNESNNNKIKHNNSSSYIKIENIKIKSLRDKEKNNKIIIKKANSGSFRNGISLKLTETEEKNIKNYGNKQSTINVLKIFLKYNKKNVKIEALNNIEKTFNSNKSFYVIICQKSMGNNVNKNDKFIFKSLMKLYRKQNRFIKIYGEENEPNVISIKNINRFEIYLVHLKNELFYLEQINELKFNVNAIILCNR